MWKIMTNESLDGEKKGTNYRKSGNWNFSKLNAYTFFWKSKLNVYITL